VNGSTTILSGFNIFAVSAMKWTPQKTITSALVFARLLGKPQRITHKIRHVLDLRHLIVVRQNDRIQFFLER